MKAYGESEIIALRGFLCKLDYPTLQHIGQFGTVDEVVEMSSRVVMSSQSIFDQKPPMEREIIC